VTKRPPPPPTEPVLSPSELAGHGAPRTGTAHRARILTLGGRVLAVDGPRLALVDAFGSVRVVLRERTLPEPPVVPGELLVVRGVRSGRSLRDAFVLSRHPGRPPAPGPGSAVRGGAEVARFVLEGTGRRLAARARALSFMRAYFDSAAFVEVETPLRVPSPGLDAHVDAIRAEGGYLITSPELHMKRLLVGGMPRLYQIARVSRAEELGPLHEPEFTMLEWYRAFAEVEDVIQDTEALVHGVVKALSGATSVHVNGRVVDVTPPFPRMTVKHAFREFGAVDDAATLAARDPDRYFQILVDAVEPRLAESPRPIVLHDFPLSQAALARPCTHDPGVAERFEIYVAGVELCNGFGELTDPKEQRRRFEMELARRQRAGAPLHPIDERFLAALEEGMPPSAGNALGVDRLVALALGATRIEDVTAFPARLR
jgi:lysyl-tRNA synthetase class 2